jgi:anti-sigma B factor antagonist
MEVTTESDNGTLIAKAGGRIDGTNAGDFEDAMKTAARSNDDAVVLDCEGLSYISSAGLRAILRLAKDLNRRAVKFVLCSLSDPIREVFQISGFDKIITIHASRTVALESLGS